MSGTTDFLVEIGTEELPPKALSMLSTVFRREIENGLTGLGLSFGTTAAFATPRRLAVKVEDLILRTEDQKIERRGPAVNAAFDTDGNPTKAALGFAASCNTDVGSLTRIKTSKGEWLSYNEAVPGQDTSTLLPDIVAKALAALPIPKPMRWGEGTTEFVRPVHWVVMLLGEAVVEATILGVESGRATRGHRFHAGGELILASPDQYPHLLEDRAYVIANFEQRRERITELSQTLAKAFDARAMIEPSLLDEVTALVEWPIAICGTFDGHFLSLPREVLIASMQAHQKYFPLETEDGRLTNQFITISNIESTDPDAVRRGNERVIRPRLSDAAFFWDQDRKTRLDQRLQRLEGIVFETRLGSILDKTNRVVHLARALAPSFGADPETCVRAALLSRCDLLTEMVGEFPELQGVMGSYYAAHDQEAAAVCTALREFYLPRFAGDAIPASEAGRCVAYADKIDTLVGIFAIGSAPTGDKDPFALRRTALGCIRIALESGAPVGFAESLTLACDGYANVIDTDNVPPVVTKFFLDRLRGYFAEQKVPGPVVEAVLAVRPNQPADIRQRIDAVMSFRQLPESEALASANKRIANILRKSGGGSDVSFSRALLQDPAELALADKIESIRENAEQIGNSGDHAAYLQLLAQLNDPINTFFDDVMVICDEPKLRANRISLLNRTHDLFTRVADIARLND